jgi:hypothetical protein
MPLAKLISHQPDYYNDLKRDFSVPAAYHDCQDHTTISQSRRLSGTPIVQYCIYCAQIPINKS